MATQITNYQCPACTGPLHFVGESGRLECDYCGSSFDIAEIEAFYAEKEAKAAEAAQKQEETEAAQKSAEAEEQQTAADGSDWDASGLSEDWGADAADMKAYCCPSCGAELLCDATTAATSCPYCGNPSVLPGQFSGILKPDFVLPFKLSKEDAVSALKQHYKGKLLLPKLFRDNNHIEELRGIYVPFWLFDGEAEGSANYMATTTRVFRHGDTEITETSFYEVQRAGTLPFSRVPVDASRKMPDDYMDSIEPYDYTELKPFSTAYLPGFLADKYDDLCDTCKDRYERNPLRILDCKSPVCQELVQGAPVMLDYLCDDCRNAFEELKQNLEAMNIEYVVDPGIVRGLDYYTKTAFEFVTTSIGAQGTVCGGGRYDNLIEEVGGPSTPGVGFGLGIERLLLTMEANGVEIPKPRETEVFIVIMGDRAKKYGLKLAGELRASGINTEIDLLERNIKGQFKAADRSGASYAVVIGDNEIETGILNVKILDKSEQVEVSMDSIVKTLCEKLEK